MRATRDAQKVEFGDFQTPPALARAVVEVLAESGLRPASLLEPTCGAGSLLLAALEGFPSLERALGLDRSADHLRAARASLETRASAVPCELRRADFFEVDWEREVASLPDPLLVIGNPPWVTNAELGRRGGRNLPPKSNLATANTARRSGLDALTGRSNFDISEWMLVRSLAFATGRAATLAMLCKTQVARRVLEQVWSQGAAIAPASLYRIDAKRHFDASVDACLLVVSGSAAERATECRVHSELTPKSRTESRFGLRDGRLVANVDDYHRWQHLAGESPAPWRWRSGIKHDCARVMELREVPGGLVNGLGEPVDAERELLFPLVKSAQLGSDAPRGEQRWLLVPQRSTGEDTARLAERAPLAFAYLCRHGAQLDARRSSIYQRRPRFAVFGVGAYSFAPWKVAISGLYKRLRFRVLGPVAGKPQVLDDTGYALPCRSQAEASSLLELLESRPAREFFEARVFWDAKRPITAGLLNQLDLAKLTRELGSSEAGLSRRG